MSKRSPRLVCKHSMVPTKCLLSLSSSRAPISHLTSVSSHNIPIACCSCFAHCSWFHSVCAPVSMFTITGTCLFLFLFLFLFLGRHQNTTKAFVQTSRPLHLHRSKPLRVHTKSACVRTRSAYLLRAVHIQSLQTLRQIHQWLVTII